MCQFLDTTTILALAGPWFGPSRGRTYDIARFVTERMVLAPVTIGAGGGECGGLVEERAIPTERGRYEPHGTALPHRGHVARACGREPPRVLQRRFGLGRIHYRGRRVITPNADEVQVRRVRAR